MKTWQKIIITIAAFTLLSNFITAPVVASGSNIGDSFVGNTGTTQTLGTSATPEASALPQVPVTQVDTNPGIIKNILTHKRVAVEIAAIFLLAAWQLWNDRKKK